MGQLRVRLFGRFDVRHEQQTVPGLAPRKVQELFAYLLLHNGRLHSRETLATMMWPRSKARQARKHLRHTLWQLRSAIDSVDVVDSHTLLSADRDWLRMDPHADLWVDIRELERAYACVQSVPGEGFDNEQAGTVRQALDLYRGDLLEGWYQEWCLFERERLQGMHLALLAKQMTYYEAHGDYDLGLACGRRALECDVAHERIHRRMMRLRYLAGDRTGALRQYRRCAAFLREELEVGPSARTVALHRRIRSECPLPPRRALSDERLKNPDRKCLPLAEAMRQLEQLQTALSELECRFQETIESFQMIRGQRD